MNVRQCQPGVPIIKNTTVQIVFYISIVILMSNLNALVDAVLHPEIPYFDKEHLIVGGVTGLLSSVLFGLLVLYARHLENALRKIKTLESYLPICASCKKIRISNSGPDIKDSWQPIESYITEKTTTRFSHGICPDCAAEIYPQYIKRA